MGAFDLLDHSRALYPVYSDMENNDYATNKLMVPPSIRRQRHSKPQTSRNSSYWQRRSYNKRSRNNRRYLPKSASLDGLSSFSSLSIVSSPNPNRTITRNINRNINKNINLTTNKNLNINQTPNTNKKHQHKTKKRKQKRRIRTFYSKKWGNKLYGLTTNYPIINNKNIKITETKQEIKMNERNEREDHELNLWQNEVSNARRSLSAFIEEENLDLNDIKTPRSVSPYSIAPDIDDSNHLNVDDFRFNDNFNYDSNIAEITDIDDDENNNSNFKIIVSAPNNDRDQSEYDRNQLLRPASRVWRKKVTTSSSARN